MDPKRRDAEFDSCRRSVERGVGLGELVFDAGVADLEALDFAEPAFASGFDDRSASTMRTSRLSWISSSRGHWAVKGLGADLDEPL
ncbi:hypothetical protein ACGF5S_27370 [Nocardia nova]|uniref:hypothetical protein n=1 Tax=Nocardia nova TaxID=37330 RepID=UPI00371AD552